MSPLRLFFIQVYLILYICNPFFICSLPTNTELVVVKGLDLARYAGRWYQIAAIPTIFEPRIAKNFRATYTLNSDGTIHVVNEEQIFGKTFTIEGTLYKADPSSDEAKFKVKFNFVPFPGNYWVLYVDNDYQYALVGGPTRLSLFILSKKIRIEDKVYNELVQKAIDEGYDVTNLRKSLQTDPPL